MKVLHITRTTINGAGRAAYRLHQGLQDMGIGSQIMAMKSEDNKNRLLKAIDNIKKHQNLIEVNLENLPL